MTAAIPINADISIVNSYSIPTSVEFTVIDIMEYDTATKLLKNYIRTPCFIPTLTFKYWLLKQCKILCRCLKLLAMATQISFFRQVEDSI